MCESLTSIDDAGHTFLSMYKLPHCPIWTAGDFHWNGAQKVNGQGKMAR